MHQCAQFVDRPKKEHGDAVQWLGRYLKGTHDKGIILKPQPEEELKLYVNADFVGNWHKDEALSRDTARSRHGYAITYAGCPLSWKSQLQGEISLSSCESEYIGLSYALREVIPIMEMLKELKRYNFPIKSAKAAVHCKVFEDNSGALEMAKNHKFRPRTKHLCCKMHHFRDYVTRNEISIHAISTHDQIADCLTKPLNEELVVKFRKLLQGW